MTENLRNREEFKKHLPQLFEYFWQFRDEGKYFDFKIPHLTNPKLDRYTEQKISSTLALIQSYYDLIMGITFAFAANKVSNEIDIEPIANYFRFRFRNYFTKKGVHDFHRFLDHITFHLNELSFGQLIKKTLKNIYFNDLENIKNIQKDIKPEIIHGKKIIVKTAYLNFTDQGKGILRDFRNIDEHRFPLGIDCIHYPFSRGNIDLRIDERFGRLFTIGDPNGDCHVCYGLPDFQFTELEPILVTIGKNAKNIMESFCQIGLFAMRNKSLTSGST